MAYQKFAAEHFEEMLSEITLQVSFYQNGARIGILKLKKSWKVQPLFGKTNFYVAIEGYLKVRLQIENLLKSKQ